MICQEKVRGTDCAVDGLFTGGNCHFTGSELQHNAESSLAFSLGENAWTFREKDSDCRLRTQCY